jgi:hypothetical protein
MLDRLPLASLDRSGTSIEENILVLEAGRVSKGRAPNVTVHQSKASLNRISDNQHKYTIGL